MTIPHPIAKEVVNRAGDARAAANTLIASGLIPEGAGPACAYVASPFDAYTANTESKRFIESDYWSGQMVQEFYR